MKPVPKTLPWIAAALALSVVVVSRATDVTDLPLKPAVLAKPNVIFGLDDSGSMDFEVLLPTSDGAFWWDADAASGWGVDPLHPVASLRSVSSPWFNADGVTSAQWRKFAYLFPNGADVGRRRYVDAGWETFAIAPTKQLAWLRSSAYNPLYFDPTQTYAPWPAATIGSSVTSFGDAKPTQVLSHPLYADSFDVKHTRRNGADASDYGAVNHVFTMLPGMRVPAGALVCDAVADAGCAPSIAVAAGYTVGAGAMLRAAIDYLPATYWSRESCSVSSDPDDTACVTGPDGATLKRHEIVRGNYASQDAYDTELQNFANWFQYYRKRKLMTSAAMGKVLQPLTGLRVGVVNFNNRVPVTMYDLDSSAADSNWQRVAGLFYTTNGNFGTPTRDTLTYIGEQFRTNPGVIQYACQRNNAFIVTDGFAYASGGSVPSYSQSTWGSGAPYQSIYAGSLADIALGYFTINLNPGFTTGKLPPTARDPNRDLHMTTYGLTLGARGTVWSGTATPEPTDATAWPAPAKDRSPTSVDDLWHATINGRGRMYLATTPAETARNIQAGLTDMLSQSGTQTAVALATGNLERGDGQAYLASFDPAGWSGDLSANPISASTGVIGAAPTWSAGALLAARDWTTRVIATVVGGTGVPFTEADAGAALNPSNAWGVTKSLVEYLRGSRTDEGTSRRTRAGLLGAVVNAEPVVDRDAGLVYLASGEGMLHAFDTATGAEHWAFVPEAVLPTLGQSSAPGWVFHSRLDGTPTLGAIAATSQRILVAGLGSAGRGFYALDVTKPRGRTEAALAAAAMWSFPAASDSSTQAKMGYALGRPVVARSAKHGAVVLVTSGYDRGLSLGDGKGRLWMLDATNGHILREFVTLDGAPGAEAGLAQVSALKENDGTVRYAYGGDLLGNLWRFDLDTGTVTRLAVLKGPDGKAQPVTAAPELVVNGGTRIVLVGTGRLLGSSDFGSSAVRSFYAIADGSTLANARGSLVAQTYTRGASPELSANPVDWAIDRGWYFDLPAGEQAVTTPQAAYGAVSFTTTVTGATDCNQQSELYFVDLLGGTNVAGASFTSLTLSTAGAAARVTLVRTTDGRLSGLTRTADGVNATTPMVKAAPIKPAKVAWLGVRR